MVEGRDAIEVLLGDRACRVLAAFHAGGEVGNGLLFDGERLRFARRGGPLGRCTLARDRSRGGDRRGGANEVTPRQGSIAIGAVHGFLRGDVEMCAAISSGYSGSKKSSPGTSRKSLMFNVHNAALHRMAHAAMAKSISRPRGARTDRYNAAAVAASSAPNTIAASLGQSASCAASSSGRRGPRCHSYNTRVVSATRSPLTIVRRSSAAERREPVNASIRTLVSSRITSPSMTQCAAHPASGHDEPPRARHRLLWLVATECAR